METYLEHTEAYLAMIREILTTEEIHKCEEAGEEIYDMISDIAENNELSFKEVLFTTFAIHHTITSIAIKEMQEQAEDNEE